MCGFFGWLDRDRAVDAGEVAELRDLLRHRGPDDAGAYTSDDRRVVLGFRRLSIIDLSAGGHQPMPNADGTLWIVFNGEVYNFAELRDQLRGSGHVFRSSSDTEVVLHAYEQWGESCVDRFIGMFAFAIWDTRTRSLFAARDRLGIKPLYYSARAGRMLIASTLKPIIATPGFDRALDPRALDDYLSRGYVAAPRSIFAAASSLAPGHTLTWSFERPSPVTRRYWQPLDFVRPAIDPGRPVEEWADALDERLRESVRYRLIADVPLGAFLSGGIDSSLVTALMGQVSGGAVRTFTVGFDDPAHDEAAHAAAVARHLGTVHTEVTATEADALALLPLMPEYYDEPFADSSQIPTYLVSRMTREHVTVALSGDGGDELFCGYATYARMAMWRHAWRLPPPARRLAAMASRAIPSARLHDAARAMARMDEVAWADYWWAIWPASIRPTLAPGLRESPARAAMANGAGQLDALERMMLHDLQRYLSSDVLTKVDRASMAVSLEARVPLLDHRVVEFALGVPLGLKRRGGVSKFLLRQVLARYVPRALTDRPKRGFAVPLARWLRGDLRSIVEHHLLDRGAIAAGGVFDATVVEHATRRFLAGEATETRIWTLLAFQMWAERYAPDGVGTDMAPGHVDTVAALT